MATGISIGTILKERVNWRVAATVSIAAVVATLLFWWSSTLKIHPVASSVLDNVASTLLVTALLSAAWEFIAKRAFLDEVLYKAGISRELALSGIEQARPTFHDWIVWPDLLDNSPTLEMFIAYGHSWRGSRLQSLRAWLKKGDTRLTITLPDPKDATTCDALAGRFQISRSDIIRHIQEALKAFLELQSECKDPTAIQVFLTRRIITFSFYRFRQRAIVALYLHRDGKLNVPTFQVCRGGWFFDFISNESECLKTPDSRTRLATKEDLV